MNITVLPIPGLALERKKTPANAAQSLTGEGGFALSAKTGRTTHLVVKNAFLPYD